MVNPTERYRQGRAVRKRVPRSSHGQWIPGADRPDPVSLLERQGEDRVQELLPIRYGRMSASGFAFLRGSAAVMTADLAAVPATGLTVQLCGDAHLLNFGVFGSPERALLFDLNDFDETLPGPFEWDVKRLAASTAVAALDRDFGRKAARETALASAAAYRASMRRFAELGELEVWYQRIDSAEMIPLVEHPKQRERLEAGLAKARRRTSMQAFTKLTETRDGRLRIISDPPLIQPLDVPVGQAVSKVYSDYRGSLPDDRRALLDRFRFIDLARKVVGVGSVGTRCYIVLLEGLSSGEPLFLQVKEATRSVLEDYLPVSAYPNHGQRVVNGQRLMQAASDIFLGWTAGPLGRHFYGRQLRDWKGAVDMERITAPLLLQYARLCGLALARAHARSGDRIAIAGYLGTSDSFEQAVADFSVRYAEQTALDHAALLTAIKDGRVEATTGV
ncbi:DUF2252 domain-containing protein [Kitasatospora camelliae]|uniref:DUF2252 domain-containing protein n=1 Tax=Kitasatospora camelliae TaxID=3156397 RepID=A0AAU8K2V2_9ACTN